MQAASFLFVILSSLTFAVWGDSPPAPSVVVEQGRRIYEEGLLADGTEVSATGAGGVALSGAEAACQRCHRRSGMGSREGSIPVPAIAGPVLFSELKFAPAARPGRRAMAVKPQRHQARPAYDDRKLSEALLEGEDPLERPLHPLMPRYRLDDAALKAVAAYLRQLSATASPGVAGGVVHLATIVTPDADPLRKRTVIDTLQAWAGRSGPEGMKTVVHVWELQGPETGWLEQLKKKLEEQPVYAALSGAGKFRWAPVQAFCEQARLPCLFPIVDQAPDTGTDFYSLYFSSGTRLEGQLLASHFRDLEPRPARVVQWLGDETARPVAEALRQSLGTLAGEVQVWSEDSGGPRLPALGKGDVLVAWLRTDQVQSVADRHADALKDTPVIFSAQLAPPEQVRLPDSWRAQARWISARSDGERLRGHTVLGLRPWLERLHIGLTDEALQSDVYGAVFFFVDAQARMRGLFNREYLLETLENAVDDRPAAAGYFHLSLGPGQRQASKDGHLLGVTEAAGKWRIAPIGPRLTP
jgi:cytochrome c553